MPKITLVAISHKVLGQKVAELMSDECETRFSKEIVPLITNNSWLFCEGDLRSPLWPGNPSYLPRLIRTSPSLAASRKTPVLGFVDSRCKESLKKRQLRDRDIKVIMGFYIHFVVKPKTPNSISEALQALKESNGNAPLELIVQPNHEIRATAVRVVRYAEAYDASHIRHLQKVSQTNECFVLAGSAHCVSLHLKTGWDIKVLRPESDVESLVNGYYSGYVCPRLLCGKL